MFELEFGVQDNFRSVTRLRNVYRTTYHDAQGDTSELNGVGFSARGLSKALRAATSYS